MVAALFRDINRENRRAVVGTETALREWVKAASANGRPQNLGGSEREELGRLREEVRVLREAAGRPLVEADARVAEAGGFVLAIGGIDNHIHLLLKLKPTARISDLMRRIKGTSSRWVHEIPGVTEFGWQVGYTAISVSPSAVASTQRYVFNQKQHHGIITPRTELITTLNQCGIEFDPRFLPDI